MPRPTDYDDPGIHAGFGVNKDKQYRAKKGEQHIVRVLTKFQEFMVHAVDDILPPKNGEPGVFNMSCAQDWNAETEEWAGECRGCERDYDKKERYVTGVVLLAKREGKSMMKLEPADSVRFWDMAKGILLDLRQTAENAGKKLNEIELLVSLKQEEGAEKMQKIKIERWDGEQLTTKAHIQAFKESGPALIEECAAPSTLKSQDLSLKKRKPGKADSGKPAAEEQGNIDDLDLDLDGGGAKPATPAPKKPATAKKPTPAPAEEEVTETVEVEDPKPAPKKPATAKAATPKPKPSTEDDDVNSMLEGLENAQ